MSQICRVQRSGANGVPHRTTCRREYHKFAGYREVGLTVSLTGQPIDVNVTNLQGTEKWGKWCPTPDNLYMRMPQICRVQRSGANGVSHRTTYVRECHKFAGYREVGQMVCHTEQPMYMNVTNLQGTEKWGKWCSTPDNLYT